MVIGKNVDNETNSEYFSRHVLPGRTNSCDHCRALMWSDEKLLNSTRRKSMVFAAYKAPLI